MGGLVHRGVDKYQSWQLWTIWKWLWYLPLQMPLITLVAARRWLCMIPGYHDERGEVGRAVGALLLHFKCSRDQRLWNKNVVFFCFLTKRVWGSVSVSVCGCAMTIYLAISKECISKVLTPKQKCLRLHSELKVIISLSYLMLLFFLNAFSSILLVVWHLSQGCIQVDWGSNPGRPGFKPR